MKNIDNPLSEYQPPSKEAMINFGIDISREAAEKYALKMNNCNLTTCRYNKDNKCTNDEKRTECVEVSEKVLCVDKKIFKKIENAKDIGNKDGKPIETSELHDMTIGVDISVDAVKEYAKSILGRCPKDNMEFSRALAMKILEETKSLANSMKKEQSYENIRNE